jgi:hypothetical protein
MRIVPSVCRWFVVTFMLLAVPACAGSEPKTGTEISENEYGLEVVDDKDLYLQTVEEDPSKELVDLEEEISGIRLDVRYATEDNFWRSNSTPSPRRYYASPPPSFSARRRRTSKSAGWSWKSSTATAPTA